MVRKSASDVAICDVLIELNVRFLFQGLHEICHAVFDDISQHSLRTKLLMVVNLLKIMILPVPY